MRGGDTIAGLLGCIAISLMTIAVGSVPLQAAGLATEAQDVEATTALIREIQFMLLRLGMDPGPIDGIAGPQTIKAFQKFEERSGLPTTSVISGGRISATVLGRLRTEVSRAILGG